MQPTLTCANPTTNQTDPGADEPASANRPDIELLTELAARCEEAGRTCGETVLSPEATATFWRSHVGPVVGDRVWIALDTDGRHLNGDREAELTGWCTINRPHDAPTRVLLECAGTEASRVVEVSLEGPHSHCSEAASFDPSYVLTHVNLANAPMTTRAIGEEASRWVRIHRAAQRTLGAAEMLGLADHCLAVTLKHVSSRRQFGSLLSTFQTIRHSCADSYSELELARALVRATVTETTEGVPEDDATWQCHLLLGSIALQVCESAIHLHGARGLVWESSLNRALRRLWVLRSQFGGPSAAADIVGTRLIRKEPGRNGGV